MSTIINLCHCGGEVYWHTYDHQGAPGMGGTGSLTRGLCERCDAVRCDAYPGACRQAPDRRP